MLMIFIQIKTKKGGRGTTTCTFFRTREDQRVLRQQLSQFFLRQNENLVFPQGKRSYKFQIIHWKTRESKSVKLQASIFFAKTINSLEQVQVATLFKKRLWNKCFPVNFAKFLRTSFLLNIYGQLLLHISNTNTRFRIFSNIPDEGMFI